MDGILSQLGLPSAPPPTGRQTDRLIPVNQLFNLGSSWTSSYPRLVVLGRTNFQDSWIQGMAMVQLKPSPEWWLDMSCCLKNGVDWWFSGVNISILRPLPNVHPMDWQVVDAGITSGNLPVKLRKPAYFPYGVAVACLYHEAAGYSGAASNNLQVAGCYYAL